MRTQIAALSISLAVNGLALQSVENAAMSTQAAVRLEQKKKDLLEKYGPVPFEFVESPPQSPIEAPLKTKKISDRDALSQDKTPDKENSPREAPPKLEKQGPADQLEQRRFDPARAPSAASTPSPASSFSPPSAPAPSLEMPPSAASAPSSASAPSAALQGLSGQDKITTPAVSRARSHGAQVYGVTSFEASGSDMGQYVKNMKEKIWLAWFPYLSFHYPKDFRSADALIEFSLNAEGEVKRVKVLESEGSPLFATYCVEAIQRAGPFGPPPREILDLMGKDELESKFAFHYW